MLTIEYSALNDIKVVMDPAPAINGNAMGTMEAPESVSFLKTDIQNIISDARTNITIEPAMAKEERLSRRILFIL